VLSFGIRIWVGLPSSLGGEKGGRRMVLEEGGRQDSDSRKPLGIWSLGLMLCVGACQLGPCTALLDAWQPSKGAPIHNDRHNQEKKVENQTCILDQQVQQIQFSVNQRIGDKFSKTCAHIYFQRDGIFILLNSVHCSVQGNQPNKSNINLEATIIEYPSQRSFMSCKLLTR
jgi:hypothetical protein